MDMYDNEVISVITTEEGFVVTAKGKDVKTVCDAALAIIKPIASIGGEQFLRAVEEAVNETRGNLPVTPNQSIDNLN